MKIEYLDKNTYSLTFAHIYNEPHDKFVGYKQ